jgi:hypothetical protein
MIFGTRKKAIFGTQKFFSRKDLLMRKNFDGPGSKPDQKIQPRHLGLFFFNFDHFSYSWETWKKKNTWTIPGTVNEICDPFYFVWERKLCSLNFEECIWVEKENYKTWVFFLPRIVCFLNTEFFCDFSKNRPRIIGKKDTPIWFINISGGIRTQVTRNLNHFHLSTQTSHWKYSEKA